MTATRYAIGGVLATAALAGLAVDTWSNYEAMTAGKGFNMDVGAYVIGIALLGALAGLCFPLAFKHNKVAGIVLVLGWLFGVIFSIGASIDRVGAAKDGKVQARQTVNARVTRAEAAVERYQKRLDNQRSVAARECRGYREGKSKPSRWPKCLTARDLMQQYEARLDAAIAKRDGLGITGATDPGGARIEALFLGAITAKQWRTYHPIMGVMALTALFNGLLLVAGSMLAGTSHAAPRVIEAEAVEIDPVIWAVRTGGPASNRELAKRLGWTEAKTSRAVSRLRGEGRLISNQAGRAKLIALA